MLQLMELLSNQLLTLRLLKSRLMLVNHFPRHLSLISVLDNLVSAKRATFNAAGMSIQQLSKS